MKKYAVFGVLCIALLVTLISCGAPTPTPAPPTTATQPTAAAQPTSAPQPTTATQPTTAAQPTTAPTTAAGATTAPTTAAGATTAPTTGAGATTAPTTAAGATTAPTTGAGATTAPTTAAGATTAPTTAAGATTAPTTAAQATTAPTTASQPTSAPAASGVPPLNTSVSGAVDLWHFWGSQLRRNSIRRVIGICQNMLPNIQVTDTFKPFGDIWTANTAAVAAGSGMPDVIVEDRPQLYQRALDKIETDLTPFLERDKFDTSVFLPFTWTQTLGPDDHSYGIPFETDVRVLYWDKNLFRAVGLDPEKPPETWDDLWTMADKLDVKNPDGTYARIGFFPLINVGPDIWIYANGGSWVKDGKPVINSPEAVETFEWIKKWVDRYGGWDNIQKFRAGLGAAPNDAFMSGKVAMLADIQGYVPQITFFDPRIKLTDTSGTETNDRLEYGVTDLPHNTGKPKGTWSGGFALSIPRGAKNPDAAWELIKCMTSVPGEASWSRDTYALAPNQAANEDISLTADPRWNAFVKALQFSKVEPLVKEFPNWAGESIASGPLQEEVWKNGNAKAVLDEAQKKIDETIAQAP